MSFNFLHHAPRKNGQHPWYESPFWGPFLIALIGSVIVLVGQLAATILPIYCGPNSLCDFTIGLTPGSNDILIDNNSSSTIGVRIDAWDLAPMIYKYKIKEYKHQINIKVVSPLPEGITVVLEKTCGRLPINNTMFVTVDGKKCLPREYEITLQGVGADGLRRNCTYFLNVQERESVIPELKKAGFTTEFADGLANRSFRIYKAENTNDKLEE